MAEHTPGLWTAKTGRTSWGGPLPPQVMQGGHVLATVEGNETLYTPDGSDRDPDAEAARDEANAYLIASAPAMAELLEEAYDALPHGDLTTRIARVLALARGGKEGC